MPADLLWLVAHDVKRSTPRSIGAPRSRSRAWNRVTTPWLPYVEGRAAPEPTMPQSWIWDPGCKFMQLLPYGMQELSGMRGVGPGIDGPPWQPPAKNNRIGEARRPAGASSDAVRPGSGWDRASGRLESYVKSIPLRSASTRSFARSARRIPKPRSPVRPFRMPRDKNGPLRQQTGESRVSALAAWPALISPADCHRGQS